MLGANRESQSEKGIPFEMERLAAYLERVNFAAYVDLLQRPGRLAYVNWVAGLFRGIGIGLGFTIVAGLLILILQQIAVWNLPIVGKFIAELVRIIQAQLHTQTY